MSSISLLKFVFLFVVLLATSQADVGVTRIWKRHSRTCNAGSCTKFAVQPPGSSRLPSVENCTARTFSNPVDHFSWSRNEENPRRPYNRKFSQRYFSYYKANDRSGKKEPSVVFFYCGNEANVELYINATGLMWENQRSLNALLIFMEHRYYGNSWPIENSEKQSLENVEYLTTDQALADYAAFLYELQTNQKFRKDLGIISNIRIPVIAFGGSYGGMLAAWIRAKYPNLVDGAIAASAPVLGFFGMQDPEIDFNEYWRVVTKDATSEAGSNSRCASTTRRAFKQLKNILITEAGRKKAAEIFHLCPQSAKALAEDANQDMVNRLLLFLAMAWDTMAMGNYPYESSYLTGKSDILLPPFPVREACERMIKANDIVFAGTEYPALHALEQATSLFNNATKKESCYDLPEDDSFDGIWDAQVCTESLPQETYFSMTGESDIKLHCEKKFGFLPRLKWISTKYFRMFVPGVKTSSTQPKVLASNIIFTNGGYDPWNFGGVYLNSTGMDITSLVIPEGAHHLDLFFSHPKDPESVRRVRAYQIMKIREWASLSSTVTSLTGKVFNSVLLEE